MNHETQSPKWWVQQWLELLNSYRYKKRLERARRYAKEGNVLSIEFQGGRVVAQVQGSEEQPYRVSLSLEPFSEEDWQYVIQSLGEKALFSAQLLTGQMPPEIEGVFIQNGLNLFPFQLGDIRSRCSCPDKANPCKHIGAVYYQLGDRFSEDPFVLFQLRGKTKQEILAALRSQRRAQFQPPPRPEATNNPEPTAQPPGKTPVTSGKKTITVKDFWHYDHPLDPDLVVPTPPTQALGLLDFLGDMALPYAEARTLDKILRQNYQQIPQKAIMAALQRSPGTE